MTTLRLSTAAVCAALWMASLYPCRAETYTTVPIADAFVATGPTGNLSGDNFGAAGALAIAASDLPQGEFQTVIQFNLSAAASAFNTEYGAGQWTIESVNLELTATPHGNAIFNSVAAGQFGVSLMQNNSWQEGTGTGGTPTTDGITYNSLINTYIGSSDQALGTFSFGGGTSGTGNDSLGLSSSLVSDVQGGDDMSLRLFPADNNISYLFAFRETGATGPELVITAVPEPDTVELGLTGMVSLSLWRCLRRSR